MEKYKKLCQLVVKVNQRYITTSATLSGKRNFRKFQVFNKRGTRVVKEAQRNQTGNLDLLHKRGVRDTTIMMNGRVTEIPEKIPELIVPDLTDCKLKPYVSYRAPDVVQSEYTSLDLFNAIYAQKIIDDYKEKKLDANGNPIEPNQYELLSPQEAHIKARKTGSDIF